MNSLLKLIEEGGWVFPPLLLCATSLWWFLGARLADVWIQDASAERVLQNPRKFSVLGSFAEKAFAHRRNPGHLDVELLAFRTRLDENRSLIQCLIAVAPLLGLLGTVTGMMETFRGLGDSALFSQTGGVAGGIAEALLTTQIGLIIAAPAIILYRYVESLSRTTLTRGMNILEWVKKCES